VLIIHYNTPVAGYHQPQFTTGYRLTNIATENMAAHHLLLVLLLLAFSFTNAFIATTDKTYDNSIFIPQKAIEMTDDLRTKLKGYYDQREKISSVFIKFDVTAAVVALIDSHGRELAMIEATDELVNGILKLANNTRAADRVSSSLGANVAARLGLVIQHDIQLMTSGVLIGAGIGIISIIIQIILENVGCDRVGDLIGNWGCVASGSMIGSAIYGPGAAALGALIMGLVKIESRDIAGCGFVKRRHSRIVMEKNSII
jgi:hypothetical protein